MSSIFTLSILLLDRKEVLALEGAILGQVSAVDSVITAINSVFSTECLRSEVCSDFRIDRSTKFTETLDRILLSDLHDDARASCHLLGNLGKLW
jgi:hypothetical protein